MEIRLLLVGLVLACAGCGYTFQGAGSVLPPDIKRVYIPLVENNSPEAGLTTLLTEALRDQFDRFGVVTVVDRHADADAVLEARILGVTHSTRSVTSRTDAALQFDTILTLAARLRRVTGGVLWQAPRMSVSKSIGAQSGAVVTTTSDFASGLIGAQDLAQLSSRDVARTQEQQALADLADKVARTVYGEAVAPDF